MSYPNIAAGQRITAALLNSMLPIHVRKASDTSRTTNTMANDPDLQVLLEANATYRVEIYLHYSAIHTAGFQTAWSVPSGASGLRSAWGVDSTVSDSTPSGIGRWGIHGFSTNVAYGDRGNTNQAMAMETGDITTTSAGTLALQWAQVTSNASASRLSARSYMRVWRLA